MSWWQRLRRPKVKVSDSDRMYNSEGRALRLASAERMFNSEGAQSEARMRGTDRAALREAGHLRLASSDTSRRPPPTAR